MNYEECLLNRYFEVETEKVIVTVDLFERFLSTKFSACE